MKKRFIFVARDIMAATIQLPVIRELKRLGHEVSVFAEGRASSIFREAKIEPDICTKNSDVLANMSDIEIFAIFTHLKPDVVCVGCSVPNNWESRFAACAREIRIPTVAFVDTWGAITRLGGVNVRTALTIDEYDGKCAQSSGFCDNYTVVGDIASTKVVSIPDDKLQALRKLCDDAVKSVLIVGDHLSNVREVVWIVTDSIRQEEHPEKFPIFGSFVHPKLANEPGVKDILAKVRHQLLGLNFIDHREIGVSTDQLAAFCDITATSFSTPLRIALFSGKQAISVSGSLSLDLMERETGSYGHPLVRQEVVDGLHHPTKLWRNQFNSIRACHWANNSRFNPEAAVEAILRVAGM